MTSFLDRPVPALHVRSETESPPPPLSFLHMAQGGVHHVLVGAEGGGRPAGVGPGTSPSVPKLTPILASLLSHRPTSPVFKVDHPQKSTARVRSVFLHAARIP